MAINTQSLFDTAKARFGADSTSSRFQEVFFDAFKRLASDLEIETGIAFDAPEDFEDDLTLDPKYHYVIGVGLDFHIATHGEWLIEDASTIERRYKDAKKSAQMQYFRDQSTYGKLGDLS